MPKMCMSTYIYILYTYGCILYNKQYYNWDILLGYGVEFEYDIGWGYVMIPSDVFFDGRWEMIVGMF